MAWLSQQQRGSSVPAEDTGELLTVTEDPEKAQRLVLPRGQYRLSWRQPYDGPAQHLKDLTRAIEVDREFKRVHIYKLDLVPTDQLHQGEKLAQVTAVVRVLDNPLPIVPVVWGLTIVGSALSGWFVLDKVEKVSGTAGGSALFIAAAVIGLLTFIRKK